VEILFHPLITVMSIVCAYDGEMRAGAKRKQKESLFAQPDAIKNSMRVVRCSGIFILLLPVERK
jgi:hypothetical protein